jgi:hypothetical protein
VLAATLLAPPDEAPGPDCRPGRFAAGQAQGQAQGQARDGGEEVGDRKKADELARQVVEMAEREISRTGVEIRMAEAVLRDPNAPPDAKAAAARKRAEEQQRRSLALQSLADALLLQRRPGTALKAYVESLEQKLSPREYAGLWRMINAHPALGVSEEKKLNPVEADRLYGVGLRQYFAGDYARAEVSFAGAIDEDDGDARYWYYRGLARLAQGKRGPASDDFVAGAKLEKINRPAPAVVSFALENVQGPVRAVVDAERARPH